MIITSKSINKKGYPYNISRDTIQIKVSILDRNSASYLEGIPLTLYSNMTGVDAIVPIALVTNEFGVCHINYPTSLIADKDIETCLMWITFEYPTGISNRSNKTRVNFMHAEGYELEFIILDANTPAGRLADPETYDIYDANTPAGRLADPTEYIILERTSIYD